ncbi:MAG: methyltransferase domain-containing protein [Herpetosiphonaceae bacterium]|nr:methyltransferase domain-containing protein [Herpetosiphonaceae bacterium]
MDAPVDLYNTSYNTFSVDVQQAVRSKTYGEDIGQSGWMTADELRSFIALLHLTPSSNVLEIGSGSGGPALFLAEVVGCHVTGLDINQFGINNANTLARTRELDGRARFQIADASQPLAFEQDTFDAIISNDSMCHIPERLKVLKDWYRVLKPGGQMLFSDAMVITGLVSHVEIALRSSIGYYFYLPVGINEQLIEAAGFELLRADDLTASAAAVSRRWHDARAEHHEELKRIEGASNFEGLQAFLWCVHTLTSERRLSRYMYLARKPTAEATVQP